jgi:hypothetical protein
VNDNGKILLFMGEGQHKIKRKAEQVACNEAINYIKTHYKEVIKDIELDTDKTDN